MRTTKAQPSQPRSLTSAFIVRLLESIISELAYCKISFLACLCSWTDWFESYSVRNPQDSFLAGCPLKCILPLILTRKTMLRRQVCGMKSFTMYTLNKHEANQTLHCSHTHSMEGNYWYSVCYNVWPTQPTVMHPLFLKKMQSWICLDISLISNIQNIGINRLFCNIYHLILLFVKSLNLFFFNRFPYSIV